MEDDALKETKVFRFMVPLEIVVEVELDEETDPADTAMEKLEEIKSGIAEAIKTSVETEETAGWAMHPTCRWIMASIL